MIQNKQSMLKRVGVLLIIMAGLIVIGLSVKVYADSFFTTNASTAYNWSAGVFYQTKVVGDVDENG